MTVTIHFGLDPDRPYRVPRGSQLSVDVEQRPVFRPAKGLLSYRVHLVYTDQGNWDWESFDLLEEVQAPGCPLSYRPVDLDGLHPQRPIVAAGLWALIVADLAESDVMAIIEHEIVADMRRLDVEAAERRAV